jgi:ABC-type uncharacterized transport system substrate-binding protein
MIKIVKELWLAVVLIAAASLLLLLSDLEQRKGGRQKAQNDLPALAIMQINSTPLIDNHVAGIIDRLTEAGFLAPDQNNLRRFNALGDLGMANTIAREIANGPYDMIITSSTVALQTVAKANQNTGKIHVFGAVTDPLGTGVGITGREPHEHPPYLAGIGTFQPVQQAFRILRELNPSVRKVGVVWNPGEQCSDACLKEAREICRQLGIELIEAIATNTTEVAEAARSLLSKGVEAIWIGGDTVAIASVGLIVNLAKQAGIPVFTNDPGDIETGAFFGLGAHYYTVGQYTADVAIEILRGKSPAEFRIDNVVPEELAFNMDLFTWLGKSWALNEYVNEILKRQADNSAVDEKSSLPGKTEPVSRFSSGNEKRTSPLKLRLVQYSETEFAERCHEGLMDGIKKAGLTEGTDYQIKYFNAQGDMSTLSSIMSSVKSDHVDLLMVISTPALQAALRQAGDHTKIVFTGVGDAVKAGAGQSETNHLPHVTGITTRSSFGGMARLISETLPAVKSVGTLFTPAEINSVLYKDWLAEELAGFGISLMAIPVTSSADISQAAAEMCRKNIGLVCQVVDNLTRPGFALIARKAAENNLPVFVFDSDQMKEGATLGLTRDYYDAGLEAAEKAVRIMNGENPADIPFSNTKSEKLLYNPELAAKYKLQLPQEFIAKATKFKNP